MGQSYSGSYVVRATNTYTNALDRSNVTDPMAFTATKSFTNGTGSGKAQVLWHDQRTLTTATGEDLDLTALTNAFGVATFTKIKAIVIELETASTGYTLQVGGDANSVPIFGAVADYITVQASGVFALVAPVDGYTVTADTGDILQIYNPSGGSVTYKIAIIGEGSVA